MGRPKKLNTNKNQIRKSKTLTIRLDNETLKLYNQNFRGRDFSQWVRSQIKFHSAYQLTPEQKNQLIREEIGILNQKKDDEINRVLNAFNSKIITLQSTMSTDEVSVVINNE